MGSYNLHQDTLLDDSVFQTHFTTLRYMDLVPYLNDNGCTTFCIELDVVEGERISTHPVLHREVHSRPTAEETYIDSLRERFEHDQRTIRTGEAEPFLEALFLMLTVFAQSCADGKAYLIPLILSGFLPLLREHAEEEYTFYVVRGRYDVMARHFSLAYYFNGRVVAPN